MGIEWVKGGQPGTEEEGSAENDALGRKEMRGMKFHTRTRQLHH